MIDETFSESHKMSHSGRYAYRLFQLPDTDNDPIRMSFEVLLRAGEFVSYQLPNEYWMDKTDLLYWDTEWDILFFTTNGQTKVFIYDAKYLTLVNNDIDLQTKDLLRWDSENKRWLILHHVLTVGDDEVDEENPMAARYKPGDYYETLIALSLPYPKKKSREYLPLPAPYKRYKVLLKNMGKLDKHSPELWEVGIFDSKNFTWAVERLPYLVHGKDAVVIKDNMWVECYGFEKNTGNVYLFRFNLDNIQKENKVSLFVNDFEPHRPGTVIWDQENSCWRAVIKGEVICPRPFYFDNMYSVHLPIEGKPLPLEVLRKLPKSEKLQTHIARLKAKQKSEMEKEFALKNTPADEILKKMEKANRNMADRRKSGIPKRNVNFKPKSSTHSSSSNFLDSYWFIVLITLLLLGATIGMIAYTAVGNHIPPAAGRNLFTTIATLFVLDTSLIISKSSKNRQPYDYTFPRAQRIIMGCISPFILLAILISLPHVPEHFASIETMIFGTIIGICTSLALLLKGQSLRQYGDNNQEYNLGCWLQWSAIWTLLLTLILLIGQLAELNG